MLFGNISSKFQSAFNKLRKKGIVTEADVKVVMKEVKLALLEADVNFKVVKQFINSVCEKACGEAVLKSLTPAQQIIKIVRDELVSLLGSTEDRLTFSSNLSVFMLVGLQGAGKTTAAGKLANFLKNQGKKPLLVACDVYRPAAIKQLQVVGEQNSVPVFTKDAMPVEIAKESVDYALKNMHDVVIIDTAGRLQINEQLMEELKDIKKAVRLQEILLVIDAMTGQEAVNISKTFNETLEVDGIIATKLDSDTRGGAILSVRSVTGKPIKFIGVGEKSKDLEVFHPDRIASRILGMGDALSLIEKAESAFAKEDIDKLQKDFSENSFSLNTFYDMLQSMKKMGPMGDIINMIPGISSLNIGEENLGMVDGVCKKLEAIILSMTPAERLNPSLLNASRKRRISRGSGVGISDINSLIKRFNEMKKIFGSMSGGNFKMPKRFFNFKFPKFH